MQREKEVNVCFWLLYDEWNGLLYDLGISGHLYALSNTFMNCFLKSNI